MCFYSLIRSFRKSATALRARCYSQLLTADCSQRQVAVSFSLRAGTAGSFLTSKEYLEIFSVLWYTRYWVYYILKKSVSQAITETIRINMK